MLLAPADGSVRVRKVQGADALRSFAQDQTAADLTIGIPAPKRRKGVTF